MNVRFLRALMLFGALAAIPFLFGCGDNTKFLGGQCFSADGQALSDYCTIRNGSATNNGADLTPVQAQVLLTTVMTGLMSGGQFAESCLQNPSSPPSGFVCDSTYNTAQGTVSGSTSGMIYVDGTSQYVSESQVDQFTCTAIFTGYKNSSDYAITGTLTNVIYAQSHSSLTPSYSLTFSGTLAVTGLSTSDGSASRDIPFTDISITYANGSVTTTGSVGGQTDLTP